MKAFRDWVFAEIEETAALLRRVTDSLNGSVPDKARSLARPTQVETGALKSWRGRQGAGMLAEPFGQRA